MTTALLDLSKIGAHIRAHHKEFANTAPKGRAKRAVLENAARRHAQWHHLKKADHNHGGIPMTMQFGPIFSNHPEGYFTGEHIDEPPVGCLVRAPPDVLGMLLRRVVGPERRLDAALRLRGVAGLDRALGRECDAGIRVLGRDGGGEA